MKSFNTLSNTKEATDIFDNKLFSALLPRLNASASKQYKAVELSVIVCFLSIAVYFKMESPVENEDGNDDEPGVKYVAIYNNIIKDDGAIAVLKAQCPVLKIVFEKNLLHTREDLASIIFQDISDTFFGNLPYDPNDGKTLSEFNVEEEMEWWREFARRCAFNEEDRITTKEEFDNAIYDFMYSNYWY